MWCLETIIQINKKAVELPNATAQQIYDECGILMLGNSSKSFEKYAKKEVQEIPEESKKN